MLAIIALVLLAIVALTVLGFAVHVLFSPWLLLVGIGVLAWVKQLRLAATAVRRTVEVAAHGEGSQGSYASRPQGEREPPIWSARRSVLWI